jgi:phage shock protein PspC (stress-responsive transcriptional regulator)
MNKVITLNLQGNAYQLEESGYEALRAYLETAARRLEGNPDKEEIVADIEQAIAGKFRARLGPHKTVVVSGEVAQVIAEMGPVEDATDATDGPAARTAAQAAAGGTAAADSTAGSTAASTGSGGARRLYKISEGALLAGVCNGLAAYTQLDVTVIRILFAVLTVFTYGSGCLLYLLLMFLVPPAETSAEKAAAYGAPSTAQEFIRRAREGYYEGMKSFHDRRAHREWRRKFKRDMRGWSRDFQREASASAQNFGDNWQRTWSSVPQAPAGSWAALPLLTLVQVLITLGWIFAMLSLVATGAVFGLPLPAGMPLWVGLVILFVAFRFIVWPLRAARHAFYFHLGRWPGHRGLGCGPGDSFVWVGVLAVMVWFADRHVPQVHTALENLPATVDHAVAAIRAWWGKH